MSRFDDDLRVLECLAQEDQEDVDADTDLDDDVLDVFRGGFVLLFLNDILLSFENVLSPLEHLLVNQAELVDEPVEVEVLDERRHLGNFGVVDRERGEQL